MEHLRTCLHGCNTTSISFRPILLIPVNIQPGIFTLQGLLQAATDVVPDFVECEYCQQAVDHAAIAAAVAAPLQKFACNRSERIRRLGNAAVFYLMRYLPGQLKNNANIVIPLVLNEEDVCADGAHGTFDLQSLVMHEGTLNAGMPLIVSLSIVHVSYIYPLVYYAYSMYHTRPLHYSVQDCDWMVQM